MALSILLGAQMIMGSAHAALATISSRTIADSEEDIPRRIYSYDMGIDSKGDVHIVYLKPTLFNTAEIIYTSRISGVWSERLISETGRLASISTQLVIGSDNAIHICYIKSTDDLYYVKVVDGIAQPERYVDAGAWHSRMQLDNQENPVFVRESATWPELVSRLTLVSTTDGTTWKPSFLDLPSITKFRLADFIFQEGNYHITYGDSALTKAVLTGKGSTTYQQGTFHNLHHASSSDGKNWVATVVDNSGSLYEMEFWTSMIIDNQTPVVGMYRYSEYNGLYNTGTSAIVARWNGTGWDQTLATKATYQATREGMGIGLAATGPQRYLGAWDYSPDNTYNAAFRGKRGNIAIATNGDNNGWSEKLQVDPFSAEGKLIMKVANNRAHILVLGDFVDAKLYYRELDLDYVGEQFKSSGMTTPKQPSNLMVKLTGPRKAKIGKVVTYLAKVKNLGPANAEGTNIDMTPALGVGFVSKRSSKRCVLRNGTIQCQVGNLAKGRILQFKIALKFPTEGIFSTGVQAISLNPDPIPANNAKTITTTLR